MELIFLILDIKILIASFDENVWIKLVLYDEEFKHFAYKKQGLKKFVDNFTLKIGNQTKLFGKLHSINDLHVDVDIYNNKCWYYGGKLHRENDLPAVIHDIGVKHWYYHGKLHRENDLPARIYENSEYWYYGGKLHRENDLPAIMYANGKQYWYYDGHLHRENDLPTKNLHG